MPQIITPFDDRPGPKPNCVPYQCTGSPGSFANDSADEWIRMAYPSNQPSFITSNRALGVVRPPPSALCILKDNARAPLATPRCVRNASDIPCRRWYKDPWDYDQYYPCWACRPDACAPHTNHADK
jgi:hypothetical protein